MKIHEQISSLFLLVLSICVLIESVRLGLGTFRNPGMGFMTFGASGLLGILALIRFCVACLNRIKPRSHPLFAGCMWKRVLVVLVALSIYAKVMPIGGYIMSTFGLMTVLFWILEPKKTWWIFVPSSLSTTITYLIFSVWLRGQFPKGLLGE